MDLDFVQEEHRQDILKLMEVCGIDLMEAFQLFENGHHSFEAAMEMHLSQGTGKCEQKGSAFSPSPQQEFGEANFRGQEEDFEGDYQKYREFREAGVSFPDKYRVRKESGFMSSLIPKFLKSIPQASLKKRVEEFIGKACQIRYLPNSLSETVWEYGWKEKFPLIVQTLDLAPGSRSRVEEVVREPAIVDYCNVQFRTYGLVVGEYGLEEEFLPLVDAERDKNTFLVIRVSAWDEVEVLDKIHLLDSPIPEIVQRIKVAKNICINKEISDSHLEKRYAEELIGNFNYQKPASISQKKKIAQDKALRKKQEQEFHATMKKEQERGQERQERMQEKQQRMQEKQQRVQEKQEALPDPGRQEMGQERGTATDWVARRKEVRERLVEYQSGMTVKLRMPNGEGVLVMVSFEEKVKYLFEFVFSLEKDLGFESEERKFDIVRPYDRLNLIHNLDKTLGQVFEDSQMESLIITETE